MAKTSKDMRNRLFGDARPSFRPYTPDDFWVLWAAYDLGSFPGLKAGAPKEEFARYIDLIRAANSACLVADAKSKWFREGHGPVAFITVKNDGWKVQPSIDFFKWTTTRMRLRVMVAAFQKARYSEEIGVLLITALSSSLNVLRRMKRYGLLYPVGRIPDGARAGDEFLFYLRGRKAANG